MKRLLGCAAAILLLLLLAEAARADEIHTIVLPCGGSGIAGMRGGENVEPELAPEGEVRSMDGTAWPLDSLFALPDFRLLGASLRFTVTKVDGIRLDYALQCGDSRSVPQRVLPGSNLWDVTEPVSAWIAGSGESLRIVPVYQRETRIIRMDEGSFRLQLTFSTSANLPEFLSDRVQSDALYDASLSLLEADSPFITRYNDTAECLLRASLELGVPYYFGGHSEDKFLNRYYPLQTTGYYRADRLYLCGLDCTGMTDLVSEKRGLPEPPGIRTLLTRAMGSEALGNRDPGEWYTLLRPGDLIAVHHGTYHIMMYLGTLRQFGWTEADAGDAAALLDYPLVIHCGGNPFYYERYAEYIRQMGYTNTWPPDGGVTVSVIMPDLSAAPYGTDAPWGKHYGWYLADGHPLLVFPLDDCTEIAWYGPEQ